jgi:hypothetical protein
MSRRSIGGRNMGSSKRISIMTMDGSSTSLRGRTRRRNIAADGIGWWIERQVLPVSLQNAGLELKEV